MAAALVWYIAAERPGAAAIFEAARKRAPSFGLAVLVGALTIWAGYRFSFAAGVPAPALWAGIHDVMEHNTKGHTSYLLGNRSEHGWWYYYLVILAVKTPLVFLGLLIFGAVACVRRVWLPLAFSLGILLFSLSGGINIGVRHVLPLYIGFSVVAAAGAVRLMERADKAGWAAAALGLALIWMAATSVLSHPDYLPYFNALAGDEPEKIAVDSDLDWGQDINRLGQRLREVGAREVRSIHYRGEARVDARFPAGPSQPAASPVAGLERDELDVVARRPVGAAERTSRNQAVAGSNQAYRADRQGDVAVLFSPGTAVRDWRSLSAARRHGREGVFNHRTWLKSAGAILC